MPTTSDRSRKRRWGFAVSAVALGLLPFVLLECCLRVSGWGTPSSYQDPFVGFSQLYPLFELSENGQTYRTARHHHYFFGLEEFAGKKPAGTLRGFCLGGSTVLGHPYDVPTAFPKWLEVELANRDPQHDYEVINCGGMSYASYRLIPILEEVLDYAPDFIIVMTGHNEFLEERTYAAIKQRSAPRAWIEDRLLSLRMISLARRATRDWRKTAGADRTTLNQKVDARLDHVTGYASYHRDEAWWQGVTDHYSLNIQVMIQLCRRANVPLILVKPGSNLRDCPPFKSENRSGLSPRELSEWTDRFARAKQLEAARPAEALQEYEAAAAIDDQHAQLLYRFARCLDRTSQHARAGELYMAAKEMDICPLRVLSVMQDALLDLAEEAGTPLVDADEILRSRSSQGIPGFDWYVDHVHPSIRGQQLIAEAIANRLQETSIVPALRQWSGSQRRRAYKAHLRRLSPQYLAAGRRRVEWLESWARRDRLREDTLPVDTRGSLDVANTYLEFAEYERAATAYRQTLQSDPAVASQMMDRAHQLFRGGRPEAAQRIIQIVLEAGPVERAKDEASLASAVLRAEAEQQELSTSGLEFASGRATPSPRQERWLAETVEPQPGPEESLAK